MTNSIIPELYCTNLKDSLYFYLDILGFSIQYQRPDEGFVMLERQGVRIMLEELRKSSRLWLTADIERPFGRGINLQIKTRHIDQLYDQIQKQPIDIFLPIEDKWYQTNEQKIGQRQFIVLDPDGYMLRFAEAIQRK